MRSPLTQCRVGGVVVFTGEGETITTIIAKKNANGTVDLGWDSMASGGGQSFHTKKVTEINGQFHVGVAGRARFLDVLRYLEVPSLHPSEFKTAEYDPFEYLITHVVPSWVSGLEKQFGSIPDQKDDWPSGGTLAVIQGRIFFIESDFTVLEADRGWGGIGSGSDYAIGAMAAGKSVEKALEIAAQHDLYTGGELNVLKGLK